MTLPVPARSYFPASCPVCLSPPRWLGALDALRSYPVSPEVTTQIKESPEWEQARSWGWVMESGELTGSGSRHAEGHSPQGIIR